MSNKFIINVKEFNINVQLKKIKHVYIRISNQNKITISAPINTNKKVIINFCLSKIKWIRLKLKQPKINYQNLIIDNNIYLWGEKYNINQLKKQNKDINKIIKDLYINQIKNETFKILNFWEKKIVVKVDKLSFQWMKSKWGCCNPTTKHIKINIELSRMPKKFLEYILVHELTHLIEANHGENFKKLMTNNLPSWKILRKQIKQEII